MRRISLQYIIPLALALVLTIGLLVFIPSLTLEYKMKVISSQTIPPDEYLYYRDLNADGISELLIIYYNTAQNLAVTVTNQKLATINQFNLPGELTEIGPIVDIHDIDSNGVMDLFFCSEKNDSLYLTIIDDLYGHPTTTREFFLDPINQYNDNGDYKFTPGGISDLNGDGHPEYILAINGGYSLQPRRVYAIDLKNDTLMKSPLSGAAVVSLDLFDLDGDGLDEIILNTVAPENFKTPFPYRDSITWLMVLAQNLEFYKPPIAMNKPPSWVSVEPFIFQGNRYLMTYHRYRGEKDYNAEVAIYDQFLKKVKSRTLTGDEQTGISIFRIPGGTKLSDIKFVNNQGIFTYNFNLQKTDSIFNGSYFAYEGVVLLDLDADGEKEYVFLNQEKVQVLSSDMKQSASLDITLETRNPKTLFSLIEDGDAYPLLFLQVENKRWITLYQENGWYKYRILVYPGIFLLLFGLFYLWTLLQNRMVARRFEKDRLISQLQLQSIKNQLDPHFTYNALNAVGSLIYKGEKDLAYKYLRGLTDLLRMVSTDSSQVTWSVSEELEFVYRFLEIEKLRFKEKFLFHVKVEDERLRNFELPKMSVLTFVENSIKHGLRHKDYDRRLDVEVQGIKKGMKISIRDNGIGRTAAGKYRDASAGQGIKMMKKYFKQFNEVTGKKARFEVIDLFEYDLKASGTLVEITIV